MFTDPLFPFDDGLRRSLNPEIQDLAAVLYNDNLTGLLNRRSLRHQLEEFIESADHSDGSLALMLIDIDHLRHINEKLGHAAGDAALIYIARTLQQELRDSGTVFRYSGDIFAAILINSDDAHARCVSESLLERIRVANSYAESELPENLTVSIGYSVYPQNGTGVSTLARTAMRALKASKLAGRNRFFSANDIASSAASHLPVSTRIRCRALIGRHCEWNRLQELYQECSQGISKFVFLAGEGGSGKTQLLNHFVRCRQEDSCYVLHGVIDSSVRMPLAVFREAVRRSHYPEVTQALKIPDLIADPLYNQLPAAQKTKKRLTHNGESFTPSTFDQNMMQKICGCIQDLSRQKPVVLLLDGLRAEDPATLQLLQHLARNYRSNRLMVVASFLSEEQGHPMTSWFISSMTREGLFETVELQRLSPEESRQMLISIFKSTQVTDEFSKWVHEESRGNPLYIEELLQMIIEEGQVDFKDGLICLRLNEKALVPEPIRNRIVRQIQVMSRPLQQVLGTGAALGYSFDRRMVADLMQDQPDFRLDLFEELKSLGFLEEHDLSGEQTYSFTNPRVRDVIYEEMGKLNRKIFHERIAEFLERWRLRRPIRNRLLAHHFSRTGNSVKALEYLKAADSEDSSFSGHETIRREVVDRG